MFVNLNLKVKVSERKIGTMAMEREPEREKANFDLQQK